MKYLALIGEKVKAFGRYIKNIDDKEPIHTFYYLLGCGILTWFCLILSANFMFANVISVLYFVVYLGFYIRYNGKGQDRRKICFRALVLDVVISIVGLQILSIVS